MQVEGAVGSDLEAVDVAVESVVVVVALFFIVVDVVAVLAVLVVLVVVVAVVEGLLVEIGGGVIPELDAVADEHWLTSPPSEKQMRCPGMSSLS